jgi:type I restriction enzyme S subunit
MGVEMKDSGIQWIGEIPKHWTVSQLKRYISIRNGSNPESEGEIPVFGSGGSCFKTCGEFKEGPTVLLGRKGSISNPMWIDGKYWNVDTAFDTQPLRNFNLKLFYYMAKTFDSIVRYFFRFYALSKTP